MLNFTVGPVQSAECLKAIGAENVPYFRTAEFSQIIFENERLIKQFAMASDNSRVAFITGSGTASMEAVVINCFTPNDLIMVVNGGSFGHRFVKLCAIHDIPYIEIKLPFGTAVTREQLKSHYSALKAYSRAGIKIETEKQFFRFVSLRIPYPII